MMFYIFVHVSRIENALNSDDHIAPYNIALGGEKYLCEVSSPRNIIVVDISACLSLREGGREGVCGVTEGPGK